MWGVTPVVRKGGFTKKVKRGGFRGGSGGNDGGDAEAQLAAALAREKLLEQNLNAAQQECGEWKSRAG